MMSHRGLVYRLFLIKPHPLHGSKSLVVITNRYYNELPPMLTKLRSSYAFDLPQLHLFSNHCCLRHSYFFHLFLLAQAICMPKAPFWPQNSNISAPSPETHWGLFMNYKLCQQARWGTGFKLAAEVLRGEKLVMITSLMESDTWIHRVKCSSQRRVKSL